MNVDRKRLLVSALAGLVLGGLAYQRRRRRQLGWAGVSKGRKVSDFNAKQLKRGAKVELEHTNDPKMAQRIAMDHLTEDPRYYVKLAKIHLDGAETPEARDKFWLGMLKRKQTSVRELQDEIADSKKSIAKLTKKKPPAKTAPGYAYQKHCRAIEHEWNELRARESAIAAFAKKPDPETPRPTACPTPMAFKFWNIEPPINTVDEAYEQSWLDEKRPAKPAGFDERTRARTEHARLAAEEYQTYKERGLWGGLGVIVDHEGNKLTPKQKAQELLADGLSKTRGYWREARSADIDRMTDREKDQIDEQLRKLADRAAKMFGYPDGSWSG